MIKQTQKVLSDLKWNVTKFTGDEKMLERKKILENFKEGIIDGMVAIKCLDEGIDVPACKTAYILASSKPKRVYSKKRTSVKKVYEIGKTEAYIHDFISIIPMNSKTQVLEEKSKKKSLKEFMNLENNSLNRNEAREELLDIALGVKDNFMINLKDSK